MDHQQKCTYRRDTLQVSQALQVSKYHIHTRVKMTTLHSTHLSVTRFFSSKINGSIETKLKKTLQIRVILKVWCLGKDDDLHTTTSVIVLEHLKLEDEVDIFFKPNIEKTVLKMLMFRCHLLSGRNILRKGVCIDGDPRGPRGFQPLVWLLQKNSFHSFQDFRLIDPSKKSGPLVQIFTCILFKYLLTSKYTNMKICPQCY